MQTQSMKKRIRTAVFPVAGLGTRFLPATKASPKEMLPVVDKPLIQYAVEEALEAGVEILVFVTSRNKRAIEDHFDRVYELENELSEREKPELLEQIKDILPRSASAIYIRQPAALGLGHAVLCAAPVVGKEPFYVVLADDLIETSPSSENVLQQLHRMHEAHGCSVVALERVPREHVSRYGIIQPQEINERLYGIQSIVEKPDPEDAPSELAVIGRYLLMPEVMGCLEKTGRGRGGEIQLTDGLELLLSHAAVLGYAFEGARYDCGDKLGYLEACVEFGLKHPQLNDDFKDYLIKRISHLDR